MLEPLKVPDPPGNDSLAAPIARRVFISYSHDSTEHTERVLAFANHLRSCGIDAMLDQYAPEQGEGWPLWMEREIEEANFVLMVCTETYLKRVQGREDPGKGRGVLWEARLIYNLVYVGTSPQKRFIPVLFQGSDLAAVPLPFQGSTYYRVDEHEGFEDLYRHLSNQPRTQMPVMGRMRMLEQIQPRSYPLLEKPPIPKWSETGYDATRAHILKRVRLDWIDGVLDRSLYKIARIELGLELKPDAILHPMNAELQNWGQQPEALPLGTTVKDVFDRYGNGLLILGAPGTGKTTLLLELLQGLLADAEQGGTPMPVVFNLSSWAIKRQPVAKWLASQLSTGDYAPKTVAVDLINTGKILPLLDGLDEVRPEYQAECVEAINVFRRANPVVPIVVCSRSGDYEALGVKLRLLNAIVAQPLTSDQLQRYLAEGGDKLAPLRAALQSAPVLWQVLETPLMLWIAMLTYSDMPADQFRNDRPKEAENRLFATFVDKMVTVRGVSAGYTKDRTLLWLSSLAKGMQRNSQTLFTIESLSPNSFVTAPLKLISRLAILIGVTLSYFAFCVLFSTFMYALSGILNYLLSGGASFEGGGVGTFGSQLTNGFAVGQAWGLILAPMGGAVSALIELGPSERLRLNLTGIKARVLPALVMGLTSGLAGGLASPIMNLHFDKGDFEAFGLLIGGMGAVLRLLVVETTGKRTVPNQGTRSSFRTASITAGLIMSVGQIFTLHGGLLTWILGGQIAWGFAGGLFALRHCVLRLVLWISGRGPIGYQRFLDYVASRLIVNKVGGGYAFVHRTVLDQLASRAGARGIPEQS